MNLDQPINFTDALTLKEVRPFIPTDLSHRELQATHSQIRERALMLARVSNAEFGNRVLDLSIQITQGRETEAVARRKLRDLLDSIGYQAQEGDAGTIKDLRSDVRLNLILRMQVQMAYGYGQWRQRQSMDFLERFPCLELFRAYERKQPRDWLTRWAMAGGNLFEGRMIAQADAPIWVTISAFGTPYPPFDFNSGMDVRPIAYDECLRLGVIAPNQRVHPQRRDFEADAGLSVARLNDEIDEVLLESLGEGWEVVEGVLHQANESRIKQMLNANLIASICP